ncbi:RNF167, partial [Symbiodinium necroappetens]
VMTDRGTGRSRGFGFVSYETPEPVDAIMSMHKEHNIMGKWIDCKPATAEGTKGAPSKGGGGKDFGKGMPKGMGKDRAGDWKGGKPDGSYGAKSYGGYAAFPPPAGCGGSGCGAYGGAAAAGAYGGGGCGGYAGGCAGYGAFGGYGGAALSRHLLAAVMPASGSPPPGFRKHIRLVVSSDGQTVELHVLVEHLETAPPLPAWSSQEWDDYEKSFFGPDPILDRAEEFDPLRPHTALPRGTRRVQPQSCRGREFEHGHRLPPHQRIAQTRWLHLVSRVLRHHIGWCNFDVDYRVYGPGVTCRQVEKWERRHGDVDTVRARRRELRDSIIEERRAEKLRIKEARKSEGLKVQAQERRQCKETRKRHRPPHAAWRTTEHFLMDSFTLHGQDDDCDRAMAAQLGLDDETYRQLKSLEGREIRPEDYDLLGRLDENLKRETLEGKCLHVFPTEVYELGSKEPASCGICLDEFETGEVLRTLLPCGHRFHRSCIDRWLTETSALCPVDKINVGEYRACLASSGGEGVDRCALPQADAVSPRLLDSRLGISACYFNEGSPT